MIEHIKMMQIPYDDIWLMLLSGQVLYTIYSSHLFCNTVEPVLIQTLSYRRRITHHPLLTGFSHKLISVGAEASNSKLTPCHV